MVRFIPYKWQESAFNRMLRRFKCTWFSLECKQKSALQFILFVFFFDSKLKRDQLIFTLCQFTKYFIISVFITTIDRQTQKSDAEIFNFFERFFLENHLCRSSFYACRQRHLQRERIDFCENSPGTNSWSAPLKFFNFQMSV